MAAELALVEAFVALRSPLLTTFFSAVSAFGSAVGITLILGGLYLGGKPDAAVLSAAASVLAGAVEYALNLLVQRSRPPVEMLEQPWTSSFPSGHATIAFATATVLGATIPQLRPYVYLVAALIAVSRLYMGVHYPSDVVAGAILGILAGLLVLHYRAPLLALLPF